MCSGGFGDKMVIFEGQFWYLGMAINDEIMSFRSLVRSTAPRTPGQVRPPPVGVGGEPRVCGWWVWWLQQQKVKQQQKQKQKQQWQKQKQQQKSPSNIRFAIDDLGSPGDPGRGQRHF